MATTLPVELLQKIFKTSLPTREEAIEKGRISFLDVPWSLTLVSPQWRAVALGMPSLWASLTIAIEPSTPSWVNYPLRLVEAQISRSGTHPLQIVFISKETPGYTTQKLFRLISRSSDRWETVELDSVWHLDWTNHSIQDKLSLLREMYICTKNLPSDVFRSAPNLRIARIVNPDQHDEFDEFQAVLNQQPPVVGSRNIELPWAQLTVFESTYRDRLQLEGMLLAPNLVECQITVPFREFALVPWTAPAQPTVFPHLKKLVLEAPVICLDALRLPALEALQIRTSWPFERLVRMLQRSACSLKRFWMKGRPPVEQFLPLLTHNPQIFELGILGSSLDGPIENIDAIIAALTLRDSDGPQQQPVYATALTSLTVRDHSEKVNMKAVLDMVESRVRLSHLHGCSRLERFCVLGGGVRIYRGQIKARLMALQADGLHVEIKPYDEHEYSLVLRAKLLRYI
ncbi:hypothetical protein DFH06DRAFT_700427 [Mycena polygramma]|nr:hypothetical protein DFH06DRAFT_700427 [Mycena polygramma]